MCYKKQTMAIVVLFAISAGVSMAELGGGMSHDPDSSENAFKFGNMRTGATEVVAGTVLSVSYDEDVDASVLARKKNGLNFKMRLLPKRVLRGAIEPHYLSHDIGEDGAITVHYRDISPIFYSKRENVVFFSKSENTLFRPEVGLTYLLFLTPRKATSSFDLADIRFGILVIDPLLLYQTEQKDEWGLLWATVENSDIPRFYHDTLFDFLIHCDDIPADKKLELRNLNKEYYKRELEKIQQILKELQL